MSLPSPSLETPRLGADELSLPSPMIQAFSPRSLTSVKRKPVPQYLYTEPPEHSPSTPSTPLLPGASPLPSSVSDTQRPLHAPLLPESELILKQCRPNKHDLTLLPIGQSRSSSATRGQHRRSFSEQGSAQGTQPPTPISGLPSPWYTTNVHGSLTPLIKAGRDLPDSWTSEISL